MKVSQNNLQIALRLDHNTKIGPTKDTKLGLFSQDGTLFTVYKSRLNILNMLDPTYFYTRFSPSSTDSPRFIIDNVGSVTTKDYLAATCMNAMLGNV
jgi:hypothetical protein